MHGILADIGIAVIAATIIGIIVYRINQPVILGYLVAGALIGPEIGLKLVTDPTSIEVISELGLILLLFLIGLEINMKMIFASGKQLILAGIGQFVICILVGLGFFLLLGYSLSGGSIDALYLSLFCALSSTTIVVKLLYDKFELDTLPGRFTLGILIFQDIWAILILAFQPNFQDPQFILLGFAFLKGLAILGVGFFLSRYVLKNVYQWIAKSPEIVVAVSIGWCVLISALADFIGLSKEMGGLIAGVTISSFPYSIHLTAKILPLRDFFLTLFFISLGMKIPLPELNMMLTVLGIVVFVILSRFLTVYPLLLLSGSGRRTCFITSLNLAQISEFSLVIASLGVAYGHIHEDIMSLVIYAMAFTSVISFYFIKYNHQIYLFLNRSIKVLGLSAIKTETDEEEHEIQKSYPITILGYHRGARALVEQIASRNPKLLQQILVIDFNLEILKEIRALNIAGIFGDISHIDTLKHANIKDTKVILSTIPDMLLKGVNNLKLVKNCRVISPNAHIVATADSTEEVEKLKLAGANDVLIPYTMIGEHLADYLENTFKQDLT